MNYETHATVTKAQNKRLSRQREEGRIRTRFEVYTLFPLFLFLATVLGLVVVL